MFSCLIKPEGALKTNIVQIYSPGHHFWPMLLTKKRLCYEEEEKNLETVLFLQQRMNLLR